MLFQFRKMLTDNLEPDEEVLSTISEAESKMKSFDVGNLYEILPYADAETEWRGIGVRGGRDSEIYRLHMADPEAEEWAASFPAARLGIWGRQEYFGDLGLRTFIRPARQDTFRFITEGQVYLADLPAGNFMRVIQSLMATAWLQTSRGENPPEEFLKESSLGEAGRRVMYALVRDFPHLFEIISRYFVIEKIVSQMLTYDGSTVMFDVRIRMHREAFKEDLSQNFWLRTDTEVLANGTMKFGFNMQQRMAGSRRGLNEEIRAFRQKLWEAFYQDYLRIR